MARPKSAHVLEVKDRLRTRLTEGVHRPGHRFPSAREVAATFGISYQTAHRLMCELRDEGLLERRPASGTYVPGGAVFWDGAHIVLADRARRESSFGARLLEKLTRRLDRDGVPYRVSWGEDSKVRRSYFPVLWEVPQIVEACLKANRPSLLLNDRPQPGLSATFLDSVSIDDFSGGAGAGELLIRGAGGAQGLAVMTGPESDPRSRARVAGFLTVVPEAEVFDSGGWYFENGYKLTAEMMQHEIRGVFCANDRLADAVWWWCRDHETPLPTLVGFDDAPVAEKIGLTTMAIPWDEFITGAGNLIKRRMQGDVGAARQLILTPRPVVRT